MFVLLGSFAPRRIKTKMPDFTPPAPYAMEDNPDSLLDRSDLVFINPVGTGYSSAVAPHKNREFWGTDTDADSLKEFIKRYLTKYSRWNSPKFLFGESYGTARSCVLAYKLHEDGVDLNGITLQSSILDYRRLDDSPSVLPTAAADAWFHKRVTPAPPDLAAFFTEVEQFASGPYTAALQAFPKADPATVDKLSAYIGINKITLDSWSLSHRQPLPDRPAAGSESGAGRVRRPGDGHRFGHRGRRSIRTRAATIRRWPRCRASTPRCGTRISTSS